MVTLVDTTVEVSAFPYETTGGRCTRSQDLDTAKFRENAVWIQEVAVAVGAAHAQIVKIGLTRPRPPVNAQI